MDLERNFTKTLATAIDQRASDLYLLPRERAYQLLTLTSGKLELIAQYSLAAGQQLISYLKYQADMAVSEHRRPQTGALRWPHHQGAPIDLRLSTVGDYRGQESLVVRFIYRLTEQYQLMVPDQWTTLQAACQKRGLILFAGPMGSGKTTTMYRLARELKEDHVIMTIEDPVEITNRPLSSCKSMSWPRWATKICYGLGYATVLISLSLARFVIRKRRRLPPGRRLVAI